MDEILLLLLASVLMDDRAVAVTSCMMCRKYATCEMPLAQLSRELESMSSPDIPDAFKDIFQDIPDDDAPA